MNEEGARRPDVTTVELIGGPEAVTVILHPYDARWPEVFLAHRRRIRDALAAAGSSTSGRPRFPASPRSRSSTSSSR